MNCQELAPLVANFSLVEQCDTIRDGSLRLSTPFKYPDGSQIDLFLGSPPQANLMHEFLLTDKGNTTAYLLDLNVRHWTTKRRKQAVQDVCDALEVQLHGGQLQVPLRDVEIHQELPSAIVRLSQACIRVADLAFTQRLRAVNSFKEDVEEFFDVSGLRYDTPVVLPSRFADRTVEVDFRVYGVRTQSLVQTLSTGAAPMAHTLMNEIFRRWFDLPPEIRAAQQLLTVYDSSTDFYRPDDIERLETQSVVLAYPDQAPQIREFLAA
jgi:hypothetical protein